METRASHILVGVFVLGLVAAAVGFILWVGSGVSASSGSITYRVKFSGDVAGLEVGSKVRYRGIPVGTVTGIGLAKDNAEEVDVRIAVRPDIPIRTTTRASIESQGLTGAPFIQLTGVNTETGDKPGPRLKPEKGKPPPEIEGQTTGLARILEEFPKAVKAVTNLTNEVRLLVNKKNRNEVAEILASARRTMNNLESASAEAKPLLVSVRKVVAKVDGALDDVRAFTKTARNIATKVDKFADGVGKVVDEAQKAVKEIGDGAKAFAALSKEFRFMVRENRRPIADFAATGLYEFSLFLTDARKFVRTADRFIKKMENDPAGFFFGNRQKGYTTRGNR